MKSFLFILILLQVNTGMKMTGASDRFPEIKYEDLLKNKQKVFLSQLASEVRYIQLETNPSCLINNKKIAKFHFADSLIFVQNMDHVLKFSVNGKFIKKITNPGRGPGESGLIRCMSVVPDKRLVAILSSNKLTYLSFDGKLVKTIKLPYHLEVKALNDSRYIAFDPGTNGFEKYNFILASDKGDTLSVVRNYTTWKKSYPGYMAISNEHEAFYMNNKTYYFKSKYNDTVYYVNSLGNKIEPAYKIDLGKYKIPDDLILERVTSDPVKLKSFKEKAVNYAWIKPFESSGRIFIRSSCMGKPDIRYLLYDINDRDGCLLVNEYGESTGILNDWDGGIDFWPAGQKNDKEIFMPVEILELKKMTGNKNPVERITKYPAKLKALESQISSLDEMDNPIIMVITLKD